MERMQTLLQVEPGDDFIITPSIQNICKRAMAYLEAGYPVHLSGPTGTGKTTLALHLAKLRSRPVMLIFGDEEFGSSDLVGSEKGVLSRRLVDNYIHSVLRTEESIIPQWVDQRLTTACRYGHTLIYDEFSRSRPEANNVLLAVLEEGLLSLPETRYRESYMQVHPEFRAVFTSNPQEYAGVYKTQDALLDRMITIHLDHHDKETEIAITQAKSGIEKKEAEKIVDIVRKLRCMHENSWPSIRASIMIARILVLQKGKARIDDSIFLETCSDILGSNGFANKDITELIRKELR
ncbi:gas vesicle protein GvpN [Candidatus Aerophobetes bacterium]|nr:gas vesicle protein GvpN [Candidatus Aerophobetes bacterium]